MARIIEITSLDDPALAAYARLTEAQLRNRLEPGQGLFIAESPKVITTALNAGLQPLSLSQLAYIYNAKGAVAKVPLHSVIDF